MSKIKKGKERCIEETKLKSSPLLSVLPEIRYMIWAATINLDTILILGKTYTNSAPMRVTSLSTTSLPPNYQSTQCKNLHQAQSPRSEPNSRSKKSQNRKPLRWLLTNRQIYNEATSILYRHMIVHACRALTFQGLFLQPFSFLNPALLQSLSFCVTLIIESDLRDGFSLSRAAGAAHGWETGHGKGSCACPFCFAVGSLENIKDQLPAVRELRLRVSFMCKRGQGNERPVVGTLADGRPKRGRLYRPSPREALGLSCVDDRKIVRVFVGVFCGVYPLRIFEGRKMERVSVEFCIEGVMHDVKNEGRFPGDRCWCKGRRIDGESLRSSGLAEEIEKRLIGV